MKKQFIFLLSGCALSLTALFGQTPNPSFELLNANGSVKNWGNIYIFSAILGGSGGAIGDSIMYTGPLYGLTTDAYSGSYALEMNNAYNYTKQKSIVGAVFADTSCDFSLGGYSAMRIFPISVAPTNISFYYKYFPAGEDTAFARLTVLDSLHQVIGEAVLTMSDMVSTYRFAFAEVDYTSQGIPAFVTLKVGASNSDATAKYGSRLLIDDVSFNNVVILNNPDAGLLSKAKGFGDNGIRVFPNPATQTFSVAANSKIEGLQIIDAFGKMKSLSLRDLSNIDVKDLSPGVYVLKANTANGLYIKRIVIQ